MDDLKLLLLLVGTNDCNNKKIHRSIGFNVFVKKVEFCAKIKQQKNII